MIRSHHEPRRLAAVSITVRAALAWQEWPPPRTWIQTPACDACNEGVMDAQNPHARGTCLCICHDYQHDRSHQWKGEPWCAFPVSITAPSGSLDVRIPVVRGHDYVEAGRRLKRVIRSLGMDPERTGYTVGAPRIVPGATA